MIFTPAGLLFIVEWLRHPSFSVFVQSGQTGSEWAELFMRLALCTLAHSSMKRLDKAFAKEKCSNSNTHFSEEEVMIKWL